MPNTVLQSSPKYIPLDINYLTFEDMCEMMEKKYLKDYKFDIKLECFFEDKLNFYNSSSNRYSGKQEVTLADFDACLQSNRLVLVNFTAAWCEGCQIMGPIFDELSELHSDIKFLKVDVDANEKTAMACKIRCVPTFHAYRDGEKIDELQFLTLSTVRMNHWVEPESEFYKQQFEASVEEARGSGKNNLKKLISTLK